jgi:hypothetical protein
MGEKLSFVATDVRIERQHNDEQFATLHVNAFASGHNLNKTYISDETLQKTAWTILDKPLLWAYDKKVNDVGSHERSEVPCGFVPSSNNNLTFTRLEDGRTMLSVVAKVWKYYSGFLMDFFRRDDSQKPVSVELEVLDSTHREDGSWELSDYAYTGITILGTKVMPAIPGAKALVMNFSDATKEYNKAYEKELSKPITTVNEIMEEGDSIVEIEDKELHEDLEEIIQQQEDLNEDLPEDSDVTIDDILEKDDAVEEFEIQESKPESESEKVFDKEISEQLEEIEQTETMQPKLPFAEIIEYFGKVEVSELFSSDNHIGAIEFLYNELISVSNELETYKSENLVLKEFKSEVDKNQLQKEINETMETVKHSLSENETTVLLQASQNYTLENIDIWKNEAMATAYKASLNNKPQAKSDMSASLPEKKEKKNGVKLLW